MWTPYSSQVTHMRHPKPSRRCDGRSDDIGIDAPSSFFSLGFDIETSTGSLPEREK